MGIRPGEMKIIRVLSQRHEGFTFTELKEKTGLSSPSLSEYLKLLQRKMMVRKDVETRKYVISEAHMMYEHIKEDYIRKLGAMTAAPLGLASKIKLIEDEEERKKKYRKLLEFYYDYLSFMIWTQFHEVHSFSEGHETRKSKNYLDDAFRPTKEFVFDWIVPLISILQAVDYNLWSDNQVVDELLKEKGEELDKKWDEFRLIAVELMNQ